MEPGPENKARTLNESRARRCQSDFPQASEKSPTHLAMPMAYLKSPGSEPAASPTAPLPKIGAPALRGASLPLGRNISWAVTGNLVYAGFEWAMLVALAKLGTPAMVGQFGLGLAIAAPVIMLANLHLRHVLGTDAQGDYCFQDYLGVRFFTCLMALLVITGIALGGGFSPSTAKVIIAVGAAKSIVQFQDLIYGLLQQHERLDRLGLSLIWRGALELAAWVGGIWFNGEVASALVAVALVRLSLLLTFDVRSVRLVRQDLAPSHTLSWRERLALLKPRWRPAVMRSLVVLALPLGFVDILSSLSVNLPRYLVGRFLGEQDLGIFVAMAYVIVGGNMLVMALSLSASPRLAKHYAAGDLPAFRRLLCQGLAGVGGVGLAGLGLVSLGGREFLTWCYRPEYAVKAEVFPWLMLGAIPTYLATFLRHGLTAARSLNVQVLSYTGHDLLLLATGLVLVPKYGMAGAAWSIGLASMMTLGLNGLVMSKILAAPLPFPFPCWPRRAKQTAFLVPPEAREAPLSGADRSFSRPFRGAGP